MGKKSGIVKIRNWASTLPADTIFSGQLHCTLTIKRGRIMMIKKLIAMKDKMKFSGLALAVMIFSVSLFVETADAQIAVKGEKVYTMDGNAITNGVVLI